MKKRKKKGWRVSELCLYLCTLSKHVGEPANQFDEFGKARTSTNQREVRRIRQSSLLVRVRSGIPNTGINTCIKPFTNIQILTGIV